jgi:hypothetical protein
MPLEAGHGGRVTTLMLSALAAQQVMDALVRAVREPNRPSVSWVGTCTKAMPFAVAVDDHELLGRWSC